MRPGPLFIVSARLSGTRATTDLGDELIDQLPGVYHPHVSSAVSHSGDLDGLQRREPAIIGLELHEHGSVVEQHDTVGDPVDPRREL